MNLKKKIYLYANSTTQRCPKEIIKIFQIEDFFYLPPVSLAPVANLELRITPRILEKIWNDPNGIIRGLEKTDTWKKTRSKKSRDTVPLSLNILNVLQTVITHITKTYSVISLVYICLHSVPRQCGEAFKLINTEKTVHYRHYSRKHEKYRICIRCFFIPVIIHLY